jgi:hypothetical protein
MLLIAQRRGEKMRTILYKLYAYNRLGNSIINGKSYDTLHAAKIAVKEVNPYQAGIAKCNLRYGWTSYNYKIYDEVTGNWV